MQVLEKINYLRKQNGWSIYKLAEESGITQSTLANMFARQSTPSLNTLSLICDAFDITLSQFFNEYNKDNLTNDEEILIYKFRKLTHKNKQYITKFIDIMSKN